MGNEMIKENTKRGTVNGGKKGERGGIKWWNEKENIEIFLKSR